MIRRVLISALVLLAAAPVAYADALALPEPAGFSTAAKVIIAAVIAVVIAIVVKIIRDHKG